VTKQLMCTVKSIKRCLPKHTWVLPCPHPGRPATVCTNKSCTA